MEREKDPLSLLLNAEERLRRELTQESFWKENAYEYSVKRTL